MRNTKGFFLIILSLLFSVEISSKNYPTKVFLMGNWADPTIVKYGDTYYLSADNDHYIPSIMIFTSKDLFNWEPYTYVNKDVKQGPAIDLVIHDDKMYIYGGGGNDSYVIYSDPPFKEWSEIININPIVPHGIDPGHIADEEGNRYLYTNEGKILKLSNDGLKATSEPRIVYDGWEIPDSIDIECVCLESPKLFKKDEYYYMVSAAGGTAGPATSHMAIVARSTNVEGPWENSPYNPMIWTENIDEEWWSKGHATLIEGPDGKWAAFYHAYLNNQRSLGRATLMSPVRWTVDNWPIIADEWHDGWDNKINVNWSLSDDFEDGKLGFQWQALDDLKKDRFLFKDGSLLIKAIDTDDPGESFPLSINPKNSSYEIITEIEVDNETSAGIILMYNPDLYVTIGLNKDGRIRKYGKIPNRNFNFWEGDSSNVEVGKIKLKIQNKEQTISYFYQVNSNDWVKLEASDDISGFQHNIFGRFISVHPGLYSIGKGVAKFNYFIYKALK